MMVDSGIEEQSYFPVDHDWALAFCIFLKHIFQKKHTDKQERRHKSSGFQNLCPTAPASCHEWWQQCTTGSSHKGIQHVSSRSGLVLTPAGRSWESSKTFFQLGNEGFGQLFSAVFKLLQYHWFKSSYRPLPRVCPPPPHLLHSGHSHGGLL